MTKKKKKLKEPFKLSIVEKRKLQKIIDFQKYCEDKKKELEIKKFLTFN